MEKITMKDFEKNRAFIIVTFILGFLTIWGTMLKPVYLTETESFITTIICIPLYALWFKAFWNKILIKLFSVKEISYGVGIVLSVALTVLFA